MKDMVFLLAALAIIVFAIDTAAEGTFTWADFQTIVWGEAGQG